MNDPQSATERVGRYQLLEPIGAGPTGSVSRAKVFGVAGFERQFAIKKFLPELTSTAATAQALSGAARQYGSLEHPRIARMSEFGVAQGQTYVAIEYVAGLDAMRLAAEAKLMGGPLPAGGALAVVSQAARAVGYAHGRGLTHLGIAPTNIIVTAEGDVKVTDFGILAATLPPRPADVTRLAQRIAYLAPEQLAGEATAAATDVFALGVLAYELVTGQRCFTGATPQAIAQAILAGPPPEPAMPRPIVRVLQRCLARSPFERFPDARALADALDAALRVAPVPGTRKDIGATVKQTLERMNSFNEGMLSGVVALNIGTGPIRAPDSLRGGPPTTLGALDADPGSSIEMEISGRDSHENIDAATEQFVRPDVPVAGPTPLVSAPRPVGAPPPPGAASTLPDLPKPSMTMPGLAPPPIPVPPGINAPPATPPAMIGSTTMPGIAAAKRPLPAIPPVKPRVTGLIPNIRPPTSPSPRPGAPRPPSEIPTAVAPPPRAVSEPEQVIEMEVGDQTEPIAREQLPRAKRESGELTMELSPLETDRLGQASMRPTQDLVPIAASLRPQGPAPITLPAPGFGPPAGSRPAPAPVPAPPPPAQRSVWSEPPPVADQGQPWIPPADAPGLAPPQAMPSTTVPGMGPQRRGTGSVATIGSAMVAARKPKSRKLPLIIGAIVLVAGGVITWQVIDSMSVTEPATTAKRGSGSGKRDGSAAHGSGSAVAQTGSGSAGSNGSGSAVVSHIGSNGSGSAVAQNGSGSGSGSGSAVAQNGSGSGSGSGTTAVAPKPPSPTDALQIATTPKGARVFLDGADQGLTPVKLPGSADRHNIALLLAGHELYAAEVDGHGALDIALKPVTPPGGPAGIKVIKCKDKERYYVYVDGKPTGMMCPTERIGCEVGSHTVEVYDVVTETRHKWDIVVKDTRLSYRVRVD